MGRRGKKDHGRNLTRTPDLVCIGNRVNTILHSSLKEIRQGGLGPPTWSGGIKINDEVVWLV